MVVSSEGNLPRRRTVFDVIKQLQNTKQKNVLVRVDFNVPMAFDKDGGNRITDDYRIRAAVPTIKAVIDAGLNAILVSHMGRPRLVQKNIPNDETRLQRKQLSLRPAAKRLSEILGREVGFGLSSIDVNAQHAIELLPKRGGGVVVLENLRFHAEEERNEENFAKSLVSLAHAFVNDAFGTIHRPHASVSGVPKLLPPELCGIGSLVSSELSYLDFKPAKDGAFTAAVIGGSKVSTKLPVIQGVLNQVDVIVLGGGLAFTFIKAKGIPVGNSMIEDSMIKNAKDIMNSAEKLGKQIILPVDAVCGEAFPRAPCDISDTKTFDLVDGKGIDDGWSGYDIGPKTIEILRKRLDGTTKIILNGPMGIFEKFPYDRGTRGLIDILGDLTKQGAVTIVGGGDSVSALHEFNKSDAVSYISTGGGAMLEIMAGNELPGLAAISMTTKTYEKIVVVAKQSTTCKCIVM